MSASLPDRLAAAEATIVALRQENERLRRRVDDDQYAAALRQALVLAASTGTIGSPFSQSRLLELIVETAIDVIDARAAHLFLVDEDADELVFVVAVGPHRAEVE